jgi:phage FluMu protein Com
MTESATPSATLRTHSRLIRNPGAAPKIEVQIAFSESQETGVPPSAMVRCGPCNKRLYDVVVGQAPNRYAQKVEDGTLIVKRRCPRCRSINEGLVTAFDGHPLQLSGALSGPWLCTHCDRSLGKIDPVRSRITVTCGCGQESRVYASDAIMVAYGISYEVARTLRD